MLDAPSVEEGKNIRKGNRFLLSGTVSMTPTACIFIHRLINSELPNLLRLIFRDFNTDKHLQIQASSHIAAHYRDSYCCTKPEIPTGIALTQHILSAGRHTRISITLYKVITPELWPPLESIIIAGDAHRTELSACRDPSHKGSAGRGGEGRGGEER